jgi:hypothetical protein
MLLVLFLGVAFIALGIYQGWFQVKDNKMTTDKEKMNKDLETIKEKAKEVGKDIKDKVAKMVDKVKEKTGSKNADRHTVSGTVKAVQPADHRLVLTTSDDREMTIQVPDAARKLADVKAGDRVNVTYENHEGKKEATAVTIDRPWAGGEAVFTHRGAS